MQTMSTEDRPAKELWNFLDSEYVKAYHGGRIEYTRDFYIAMYKARKIPWFKKKANSMSKRKISY